jgi:DNA-3-methyladenine glycosylase
MSELGPKFFERHPVACARDLIGCVFRWNGCEGRIVETEAYAAVGDDACHTFFRKGARDFVARQAAGDAYVYLNYGVHWLFNILTKDPADELNAGFVLFRALEPVAGLGLMRERRPGTASPARLCAGPGRLTRALGIDGGVHGTGFLGEPHAGIRVGPISGTVIACPRIGISRAQELNWRFLDSNSLSISRKIAKNHPT